MTRNSHTPGSGSGSGSGGGSRSREPRNGAAPGASRRLAAVTLAALALAAVPAGADAPVDPGAGAQVFASRCAVCHGPQAGGIPGSFPSLHDQIIAFAKAPPGREYLVMVVTTGLMGGLKVAGVSYNGVMPAQSLLSEADVAAVLNYLAGDLGRKDLGADALTAAEVAAIRSRHPDRSAQSTRALRPATDP